MKHTSILTLAALTFFAASSATAQSTTTRPSGSTATEASARSAEPNMIIVVHKPSYPFTTCLACNKALPTTAIDYVKDGHLFRLDVATCQAAVDADVTGMTKKVEDAVIVAQKPTYPMQTSAVSGIALPATAIDHVYGTRLVRLAAPTEVTTFKANPAAAMTKLDKAYIDAQLPTYTLTKCLVAQEPLGADAVSHLYGTKLVRFCCASCKTKFDKTPEIYMTALTAAR